MLKPRHPRVNHWTKAEGGWQLGQFGRPTWLADGPVGPTASSFDVASSLVENIGLRSSSCSSATQDPWLPPINTRGWGKEWNTHTHDTLSTHLSPLELEAFILDA